METLYHIVRNLIAVLAAAVVFGAIVKLYSIDKSLKVIAFYVQPPDVQRRAVQPEPDRERGQVLGI